MCHTLVLITPFLSTLSLRRATLPVTRPARNLSNFYPRSPCGERRGPKLGQFLRPLISIHALLAESDGLGRQRRDLLRNFYPRSPCGERPPAVIKNRTAFSVFLSTLSLRRATGRLVYQLFAIGISIHALLAESDPQWRTLARGIYGFLSTLSLRRATSKCTP